MGTIKENTQKIFSSVMMKMVIIGIIILTLLIPAGMIKNLIREREEFRRATEMEIQDKWGKDQTISGPIITIPYLRHIREKDILAKQKAYIYILPEKLKITGNIEPEIRYRSIHKVVVYNTNLTITGHFEQGREILNNIPSEDIQWKEIKIDFGVSDMRGIQKEVQIFLDEKTIITKSGTSTDSPIKQGFHGSSYMDINTLDNPYNFRIEISLNGSGSLNFIPLGKTTDVRLSSEWMDPAFYGAFLPDDRTIDNNGFSAHWTILHYNRNYPQIWLNRKYETSPSSFGVRLFLPVDEYQKTTRSVKYVILFLTLTFTLFFFIEILHQKKVHPVQYLMVGASLIVFYILLLSLSEQTGFLIAYLISAAAIILQISLFIYMILHSLKLTLLTSVILTALYSYLFVLLQIQDYALLIGSVGLFVILGIIMYLSKNIDWYKPILPDE